MRVLVTGGAGFIGSAVCRHFVQDLGHEVMTLDKLTYAGNLASARAEQGSPGPASDAHALTSASG
jgi:dTDP-glucose 4,6-dehydratase